MKSASSLFEVLVNSFESPSTDTEEPEVEQSDLQTDSPESETVSDSVSAPASTLRLEVDVVADHLDSTEGFAAEPISHISSELTYACLLIPRFSDHYLTGDITNDLATWMKDICIAYGWRLNAITIRPGYLQWVMTVPLTTNPAQFMRVTRQQTSKKILEEYPRFARKNLSLDFWAPGFSVAHGNALQSTESISSFISEVRRQQGSF